MQISDHGARANVGIDIWMAQADRPEAEVRQYAAMLSDDEIARSSRFHAARDRHRYIVRHGILRLLLSAYTCCEPLDVEIRIDSKGKPYVMDQSHESAMQFNVSHSAGLAVLAFGRCAGIGVDIERINDFESMRDVAALSFTSTELNELDNTPETGRIEAFFKLWARKEAVLKACGAGLLLPATCVDVSSPVGGEKTWIARIREAAPEGEYRLTDIAAAPGFAAAVAVTGSQGLTLTYRRYELLTVLKQYRHAGDPASVRLDSGGPWT
jgi:4'-phosphopantetheinyl transferase